MPAEDYIFPKGFLDPGLQEWVEERHRLYQEWFTLFDDLNSFAIKVMSSFDVHNEGVLWRKISIHLCHRYGGKKLKEIGDRFGMGDAAVSMTSKRLLAQAAKDRKTKEALESARNLLIVETPLPFAITKVGG